MSNEGTAMHSHRHGGGSAGLAGRLRAGLQVIVVLVEDGLLRGDYTSSCHCVLGFSEGVSGMECVGMN